MTNETQPDALTPNPADRVALRLLQLHDAEREAATGRRAPVQGESHVRRMGPIRGVG